MGNPKILYWKWDESILIEDRLEQSLNDIFTRMQVDLLYVSIHHLGLTFSDPKLLNLLEKCTHILETYQAKLLLDLDIRGELAYIKKTSDNELLDVRFMECDLDEDGNAKLVKENPLRGQTGRLQYHDGPMTVAGAWAFHPVGKGVFDQNSLQKIKVLHTKQNQNTEFVITAGKENSGKRACFAVVYTHGLPDLFSSDLYNYYEEMFQSVSNLKLGGVANDEWGYGLVNRQELGSYILDVFPYSPILSDKYFESSGKKLEEDLIHFAWTSQDNPEKPLEVINRYVLLLRDNIRHNNDWFYETGKKYFGEDAFIGVHPTLWCDKDDSTFDTLHNGLGWWEVKRDYAQTDEYIILPIRLAMAHKWSSPVWYNMWYSNGTNQLFTFMEDTWQSARFGGRTNYLGYECPNESVVYWLRAANSLEMIDRMEKRVELLDTAVASLPDCRLLIVFGMEAVTNWYLNQKTAKIIRTEGRFPEILRFSDALFEQYLCDLVPSTEISNGSVLYKNGKLQYGNQQYDAMIYLETECMEAYVMNFMTEYTKSGGPLMLAGNCEYYSDGTNAKEDYQILSRFADINFNEIPDIKIAVAWLRKHNIPTNRWNNGCRFQDGTAVFTTKGSLPNKNFLKVDCKIDDCHIVFEGEDFLTVKCRDNQIVELHTPAEYTLVVNEELIHDGL